MIEHRSANSMRMKLKFTRWLKSMALACWALPLLAAGAERPNILWLVSEDNDTFLHCYGDPVARTPALDKLAQQGVLFERCFAQPVCAPSRFTLITGMYPATCGPAEHMRASGKIPAWLKGFPSYLRAAGYYTCNNAKTDYNCPVNLKETWDASGNKAHWRNRAPGQPFFSVFNHEVTHESCLFPTNEPPAFEPAKMRIPPYQSDTPEIRADWARYYTRMERMDRQIAAKLADLAEAGLAEDTIVFYYSDNGGVLPRSKRFLEESGTHVPLIVYFPPKWRQLAPAVPGAHVENPVHFIDFAPTVLSLAGVEIPKYMQGRAFAGRAKGAPNEFVFCSRDRMDERYDMMRSAMDQRWLYIRNYRPDLPYVQPLHYMFQARGYQSWERVARDGKLTAQTAQFWGPKPAEELYDMAGDPDSVRNLASDPSRKEILERMRAALTKRIIENMDNGFLPEGSPLEGYEACRRPGAFPVEKVLAIATLASEGNPKNIPELINALQAGTEPERWWGAQGCTILGTKATPAKDALRKCLSDTSGAVQVAAAEALLGIQETNPALEALSHWLRQDDNLAFALQAANVLDRIGPAARPALAEMQTVAARARQDSGRYSEYIDRILTHAIDVLEGRRERLVSFGPAGGR